MSKISKAYNFSFFFDVISYKSSYYHNIKKAQWQPSPTEQGKNRLKYKNYFKNLNIFICICILRIVFNFINGIEKIWKDINTLYFICAKTCAMKLESATFSLQLRSSKWLKKAFSVLVCAIFIFKKPCKTLYLLPLYLLTTVLVGS